MQLQVSDRALDSDRPVFFALLKTFPARRARSPEGYYDDFETCPNNWEQTSSRRK